jgi:hypothetical protein
MPVKDIDGGLVYQGFSPRTITDRLPVEKSVSVPFRFGGSNVRSYLPPVMPSIKASRKIKR